MPEFGFLELFRVLSFLLATSTLTTLFYCRLEREYERKERPVREKPFASAVVAGISAFFVLPPLLFAQGFFDAALAGSTGLVLALIALMDWRYQLIPNRLVFALAVLALVGREFFAPDLTVWQSLTGGWIGGGVLGLLHWFSKGGLGFGDVKLAAALGLMFDPYRALHFLLAAGMSASLAAVYLLASRRKGRNEVIAFGPYLVLGGWVVWVFDLARRL